MTPALAVGADLAVATAYFAFASTPFRGLTPVPRAPASTGTAPTT